MSRMTSCRACGRMIAKASTICPHCGASFSSTSTVAIGIIMMLVIAVILLQRFW